MISEFIMIVNYDSDSGFSSYFNSSSKNVKITKEVENALNKLPKVNMETISSAEELGDVIGYTNEDFYQFAKTVDTSGDILSQYKKHVADTTKQLSPFSKTLSTLKSFGGKALSFLANAGASFLAVKGFELAVKGIDYLIHYQDRLIEKGEQARDSIQEQSKAYTEQKSTLGELTARYSELANGVSISGNKISNVGLTTDEYKEFLDISNQIASTAPSLAKSRDVQGNAILNAGTSANALTTQVEDYLKLQRDLTYYNTKNNIKDQYTGLVEETKRANDEMASYEQEIETAKKQYENLSEFQDKLSSGNTNDSSFILDSHSLDSMRKQLFEMGAYLNEFYNEDGTVSVILDTSQIDENELKGLLGTIEELKNEASKAQAEAETNLRSVKNANEESMREILPSIQTLVNTTSAFDAWEDQDLANNFREKLTGVVTNLSTNDVEKGIEKYGGDLVKWANQDIIDPIANLSDTQKETWNKLFEFEPDKNMSVKEIAKQRDAILEEIAGFSDSDIWTKSSLAKAFGFAHEDEFGNTVWNNKSKLDEVEKSMETQGKAVRDWMNELTQEDFEIAYSIVGTGDEDALNNLDSFKKKFNELKNESELKAFSLDSMRSKVASTQTNISNLSNAFTESMSGTGLTADTITAIKDSFSDLGDMESIDLNGMFVSTADGVKMNSDALENLLDVQHEFRKNDFKKAIDLQNKEIKKQEEQLGKLDEGTAEYDAALKELINSQKALGDLQQSQSQYNALYKQQKELFSDYSEWQRAQQTENAGDKYTNMVAGLKNAKELWDKGLVGTDDFKSFAALISPTGADDAVNFAENYGKAMRYLTEDESGVFNFLNDLETKGLAKLNEETKEWEMNLGNVAEAAKQMGMGEEFMTSMFGRLEDYGFHNNVIEDEQDGILKLSEAYAGLAKAQAKKKELEDTDSGNTSAIEAEDEKIAGYTKDIEQLQQNISDYVENYADNYKSKIESAKNAIELMNQQRKELLKSDDETDHQVAEAMEQEMRSWAEQNNLELDAELEVVGVKTDSLEDLQNLTEEKQIDIGVDLNYDKSAMSVEELDSKINELENAKVNIDVEAEGGQEAVDAINSEIESLKGQKVELQVEAALKQHTAEELLGMNREELINVGIDVDSSSLEEVTALIAEIDGKNAEASVTVRIDESQFNALTDNTTTVKVVYDKDSSVPDNYQPKDKDATVEFDKDSSIPDNYQPKDKDALVNYALGSTPSYDPPNIYRSVVYTVSTIGMIPKATGTMIAPAHADGTAYNVLNMLPAHADGNVAIKENQVALTNELGTESLVL